MKPAIFLTGPPLAFFAAAMLAGLVKPHDPAARSNRAIPSAPRERAGSTENSKSVPTDIESTLSEMERRVVWFSPTKVEIHNAEGMESRLLKDLRASPNDSGYSGLEALNYSIGWARENPAELFEWFIRQELVSSKLRKSLAAWLFSEWAKQDMTAALAALARISKAESRAQALVSTLEVLSQKDPAKARELLLQNIDSLDVLKSVEFQEFEPGKARTDLILSLPPGKLRSLLMAENIRCLMYEGIGCGGDKSGYYAKAALGTGLWNQLSTDERRELVDAGLRSSEFDEIQLDGLEDLIRQRAEVSNDPRQASLFMDRYCIAWAKRDAAAAVSWTMSHLKGDERREWTRNVITLAADENFDAAIRVWRTLPEGTLRKEAAKYLLLDTPADHEAEKAMLQDSLPKPGKW